MTAMVFPASPTIGQIYAPGDGSPSYVYRGDEVWQNIGMGYGYGPVPFTATAGQTTINAAYQVGAVDVFIEGVRLDPSDYTATNGTSIVLTDALLGGEMGVIIPHSVLSTLEAPARPTTVSGLGEFVALNSASGAALALPAGGSWAYFRVGRDGSSGAIIGTAAAGVAAGGTTVGAATAGTQWYGFAWRIS